jgi:hypothetical protein
MSSQTQKTKEVKPMSTTKRMSFLAALVSMFLVLAFSSVRADMTRSYSWSRQYQYNLSPQHKYQYAPQPNCNPINPHRVTQDYSCKYRNTHRTYIHQTPSFRRLSPSEEKKIVEKYYWSSEEGLRRLRQYNRNYNSIISNKFIAGKATYIGPLPKFTEKDYQRFRERRNRRYYNQSYSIDDYRSIGRIDGWN